MIALTTLDADQHVADAIGAGAVGFLLKDVTAEGLVDAVRRAAAGESVIAPSVLARLMGTSPRIRRLRCGSCRALPTSASGRARSWR